MAALGIISLPAGGAAASGLAPAPDGLFSIGDMARAFDASQRTLRFYGACVRHRRAPPLPVPTSIV